MYTALTCDTASGHKPTAVTTLKMVINKHMQRDNVDYTQCRYVLYAHCYNGTFLIILVYTSYYITVSFEEMKFLQL